jgi:hypothetical protein
MPPTIHIMRQGAGANLAEAVEFGEVFDADDGRHFLKAEMGKAEMGKLKAEMEKAGESGNWEVC